MKTSLGLLCLSAVLGCGGGGAASAGAGGEGPGAMGAGGGGGGITSTPTGDVSVWTAGPGRKIQPTTAPSATTSVTVSSVRDAYVGAQIAVVGKGGHLEGVTLALEGDLTDGLGHTLSKHEIALFREQVVDFSVVPSDIGTGNTPAPAQSPTHDGRVPDPLVPLVDPYTGAMAGMPFDVAEDHAQGVFVDVHVPKGQAAGTYTGSVKATASAGGSAEVPLSVTVWGLDLPDMRSVTTHFKMTINNLFQYHAGMQSCSGGSCYEDLRLPKAATVLERYEDLAHAHRIDTGQGLVNVPLNGCTPPSASDFDAYDAAMQPYMDGSYFSDGVPSSRFDVPFQPGQDFGADAECAQAAYVALARAWSEHLRQKGWFPPAGAFGPVAYAYDEPLAASSTPSDVDAILQGIVKNASWLRSADPKWTAQIIDTTSPVAAPADPATSPLLDRALGVYVVALPLYGDVWDHGPFYGRTQWQQNPDLFAKGLGLWFYEGNSVLPPFPTFASNTLDALEPVIMMWGSWYEKATGFLFWDIAYWTANDPWGPEIDFGKTGDGVLVYPGNHDGSMAPAGSPSDVAIDGPVPSYRLKMIRQGLEDWALFRYADSLGLTSFVQEQVGGVYSQFGALAAAPPGMPYWTTDEAKMDAIRAAVVQKILAM